MYMYVQYGSVQLCFLSTAAESDPTSSSDGSSPEKAVPTNSDCVKMVEEEEEEGEKEVGEEEEEEEEEVGEKEKEVAEEEEVAMEGGDDWRGKGRECETVRDTCISTPDQTNKLSLRYQANSIKGTLHTDVYSCVLHKGIPPYMYMYVRIYVTDKIRKVILKRSVACEHDDGMQFKAFTPVLLFVNASKIACKSMHSTRLCGVAHEPTTRVRNWST